MNIYEASINFEKIRRKGWPTKNYLILGFNTKMFESNSIDNDQYSLSWDQLRANDWEEYKEPKKYLTTKEAMQALIDGNKLQADNYDEDIFIYLCDQGHILFNHGAEAFPCFSKDRQFYIYEGE